MMLSDHGWVHETQPYAVDRVTFWTVAIAAILIVGILIKQNTKGRS